MKRIPILLLAASVLAASLTACGSPAASSSSAPPSSALSSAAQAYTFTDDLGRTVTVEQPERVAALIGSFADVWCLAGGQDTLVAAAHDAWTSFDLGLSDTVADLGAVKEPNLEVLLAAQPDFILASCNTTADLELESTFESAGIPTAYFDIQSFDDYLNMLKICTDLTGCPENYEAYGLQVQEQVEAAKAVFAFWGIPGKEPETGALVAELVRRGKAVGLPRMLPEHRMEVRRYDPDRPLVQVSFGISEPGEDCPLMDKSELDLALVPAVCYDRRGYRLGFGGGYYDRWLAGFSGFRVGLCRGLVLQDRVPTEAHDSRVDLLLTEREGLSL